MFNIFSNSKCINEKKYVLDIIFNEFLGLKYNFFEKNDLNFTLIQYGSEPTSLIFKDIFFNRAETHWLKKESLPELSLCNVNLDLFLTNVHIMHPNVPFFYYEENSPVLEKTEDSIFVNVDIFGSIFFLLSRYEEGVHKKLDKWGRLEEKQFIAFEKNIMHRPLVNEYLEILKNILKLSFKDIKFQKREFNLYLSHDIDLPLLYYKHRFRKGIKRLGVHNQNKKKLFQKLFLLGEKFCTYFLVNFISIKFDPFNTFDYLMNISEKNNVKSEFYFITEHPDHPTHEPYALENRPFSNILKNIAARGHTIGLHSSFDIKDHPETLKKEFQKLLDICAENDIHQQAFGGRHHYLNWNIHMPYYWDEAGLSYDSTLGFSSSLGFRTGTCYEYSMYDLIHRKKLALKQKPLVAMDVASNKGYEERLQDFITLKNICKFYEGTFGLLWHNSSLRTKEDKKLYESILEK
jgi:hypothetical protein